VTTDGESDHQVDFKFTDWIDRVSQRCRHMVTDPTMDYCGTTSHYYSLSNGNDLDFGHVASVSGEFLTLEVQTTDY